MKQDTFYHICFLLHVGVMISSVSSYYSPNNNKSFTSESLEKYINETVRKGKKVVQLPDKKIFYIDKTLIIPNNMTISGNGCELKGKMIECKTGYKPINILKIENGENIVIQDITFDGGLLEHYFSETKSLSDVANTIKIENSKNITLKNCTLKNVTSNWIKGGERYFGALGISNSQRIVLINFQLINFKTEGVVFYNSTDIIIEDFKLTSKHQGWTPLHFWYCRNILCKDSEFDCYEGGGSTINGAFSNALFDNVTIKGGKGIQFSNELNETKYDSSNITIKNSSINTKGFGIGRWNYDNTICRNIKIIGTQINIKESPNPNKYYAWGVRLDNVENVDIVNCKINASIPNSAVCCITGAKNIIITDNEIKADKFLFLNLNDFSISGLTIKKNDITFIKLNSENENNSVFLFKNRENTKKKTTVSDLLFVYNKINNLNGNLFENNLENSRFNYFNNIEITSNIINSQSLNNVFSNINNGGKIRFINNQFLNQGPFIITDFNEIDVVNNTYTFSNKKNLPNIENLLITKGTKSIIKKSNIIQ